MSPIRGASTDSGRSKRVRKERNVYSPSRNEAKHRRGLERLNSGEPVQLPKKRGRYFEEKHKMEPMTPPKISAKLSLEPDAQFKEICDRLRKRTARAIELTEGRIVEINRGLPRLQVNFFQHGEFGEGELADDDSHETDVLKKAAKIEGERSTTSRAMPKRPEPPHGKSHWDYVVEEMVNISAEVREDARWKSQSCRRIARAVQRYFADSNWRQEKQRRELELQLRRQASAASRDVRHFWKQIEQIAKYVYNQEQEVEKRAIRERQLHDLLGQTEKYSSMIAGDFREIKKEELLSETELRTENAREGSSDSDGGGRRPQFRSRRVTLGSISDASFADTESSLRNSFSATDEQDDEEFVNVDEAVDDEETMAAEEAKAQERGEGDNAEELTTLTGEADVDIIELLKSQGIDPESYLRDHGNYMEEEVTVEGDSSTAQRRAVSPDGFVRDAVKSGNTSPTAETTKPDAVTAESRGPAVSDDFVASSEQETAKDDSGAQSSLIKEASPGGSVDKSTVDEVSPKELQSGHLSKNEMAVITSARNDSATDLTLVNNPIVYEDRAGVQNSREKEPRKDETQTNISTDLGPHYEEVPMEASKDTKSTPGTVAKDRSESKIGVHGERKEDTAIVEIAPDAKETPAEEDCHETVVPSVPKITVKEQKSPPIELAMRMNEDSEDESTEQETETTPPELPSARDVETLASAPLKQECMKEFANLNDQAKERLTAVMAEQGVEPATYFDDSDESESSTEAVNSLNATPVPQTSGDHDYDEAQALKDDIGDDEATMETAEKEITAADVAMETSALQDEMDIPLEEVLRRSGVDPALYNLAAMDSPDPEDGKTAVEESGGRGRRRRRGRPRTTGSDAGVEGSAVPRATETKLGKRAEGSSNANQHSDAGGGEGESKSLVEAGSSLNIEGNTTTRDPDQEDPALPEKAFSKPEALPAGETRKLEKAGPQPYPEERGRLLSGRGRDASENGPSEARSIVNPPEKYELRELVKVVKTENAHDDHPAWESGAVHGSDSSVRPEHIVGVRQIPAPKQEEDGTGQENSSTTKHLHSASMSEGESKEATVNKEGDNQIEKFVAGLDVVPSSPVAFVPPSLLHGELRGYQADGVRWLVTLHEKLLNGILADEMGLGKTIMTIALLAWLAERRGIWGPHLIIVPTSVMVNWEVEFKKWCPGLKILTYFGSLKERRRKRQVG
uniref:Helicase ATP-binding domain-containing protein n=1 Tax=Rhodosorus marinus TaxID=101924 RepID=A0A7S0BHM5_9RHOD|mmetsp:Transcript_14571/g.21269  ORF Transcript_14571/g.21269 Transcript_14571/m.21269 type:complete len:1198 (+) Transcript_14571:518-4111(+)